MSTNGGLNTWTKIGLGITACTVYPIMSLGKKFRGIESCNEAGYAYNTEGQRCEPVCAFDEVVVGAGFMPWFALAGPFNILPSGMYMIAGLVTFPTSLLHRQPEVSRDHQN